MTLLVGTYSRADRTMIDVCLDGVGQVLQAAVSKAEGQSKLSDGMFSDHRVHDFCQ